MILELETPAVAYKLLRKGKNGKLHPLFINKKMEMPVNVWLKAEDHKTKGFSHRPGWHCSPRPEAPHLSEAGREWWEVEICNFKLFDRPEAQGGTWALAEWMRLIKPCKSN